MLHDGPFPTTLPVPASDLTLHADCSFPIAAYAVSHVGLRAVFSNIFPSDLLVLQGASTTVPIPGELLHD